MHPVKQEYNKLLARWKKAETLTDLTDKQLEALKDLNYQLAITLDSIGDYTYDEAINGFKEDEAMANRADRRRCKIEDKDPVLNLKESEIREQLQKVKKEAIREAAKITSALFSLSLNNKHGFGEKRINELLADVKNQMECVLSGHLSGADVVNWCKEKNLNCFDMEG